MKKFVLILALLVLCGCAAEPAPAVEEDSQLRFEFWYWEDSKFILDLSGTVTRGGETAQAEFSEELLAQLEALAEEYPIDDIDFYLTSKNLKKPDEPMNGIEPLAKYSVTIGGHTVRGDATAWNYVETSEQAARFCALCDELRELLHTVPEFLALPEPPPVL